MLPKIGLACLFFLPVIESFDRDLGFTLLIASAVIIGAHLIRQRVFHLDIFDLLFLCLVVYLVLILPFSWSIVKSYTELLRYFAYFFLFLFFRRIPDKEKFFWKFLSPMVIVNSLILSFLAIVFQLTNLKMLFPIPTMNLFFPSYGHNRLVNLLIYSLPLVIIIQHYLRNKYVKFIFFMLAVFFLEMVFLSYGRGVLLSMAMAFLIFEIYINQRRWRIFSPWALILGFLAIIFLISSFFFSNFIFQNDRENPFFNKLIKPVNLEQRITYFKFSLQGWLLSPMIGTGLDTFPIFAKLYQTKNDGWSLYQHNQYLEMFQSAGIFGGTIFLIFFLLANLEALKRLRMNPRMVYNSGLWIALITSEIHSIIDYDWHYLSIFLLFLMFLSQLIPMIHKKGSQRKIVFVYYVIFMFLVVCQWFFIPSSEKMMKKASSLYSQKRYQEAELILSKALYFDPHNIELTLQSGDLHFLNKKYDLAHKKYQGAIKLSPSNSRYSIYKDYSVYIIVARLLAESGHYENALSSLKQANQYYPFYNGLIKDGKQMDKIEFALYNQEHKVKEIIMDYLYQANIKSLEYKVPYEQMKKSTANFQ